MMLLFMAALLAVGTALSPAHALPPPTKAELDGLIQAYGPLIKLHPTDPYHPDDPAATLDIPGVTLKSYIVNNEGDFDSFSRSLITSVPTSSATILEDVQPLLRQPSIYSGDSRYRYLVDFPAQLQGNLNQAKAYVRVQPYTGDPAIAGDEVCASEPNACVDLQFWIYYPWNGPGKSLTDGCGSTGVLDINPTGTARQHHSDWENIKVRVARDNTGGDSRVVAVRISAHDDDGSQRAPGSVIFDAAGHPVIYSAQYSHAHYFAPGQTVYDTKYTDLVVCTLRTRLYDLPADGGPTLSAFDPAKYEIVSSAWPGVETTTHDWLFFEGQWGEFARVEFCIDLEITEGCPDQAIERGKSGLMRRGILTVDAPQNANLGMLRFIEAIGSPYNASTVPDPVGVLSPAFDPNVTSYTLELGGEEWLGVTAIAAEHNASWPDVSNAKVEIRVVGDSDFECLDGMACSPITKVNGRLLGAAYQFVRLQTGPLSNNTIEIKVTAAPPSTLSKVYTVNVVRACVPDAYETVAGNTFGDNGLDASCSTDFYNCPTNNLPPGTYSQPISQIHNICGVGDEDWVRIDNNAGYGVRPSSLSIWTSGLLSNQSGATRDTRIELYQMQPPPGNPQGAFIPTLVRSADSNTIGAGDWAIMSLSCEAGAALDPGIYFAKITQQTDSAITENYFLRYYEPVECTAYNLALSHTGQGADPQASPYGCSSCGQHNYLPGQVVTLTATPAPGWRVAGWQGTDDDASKSNVNTVTMLNAPEAASVTYEVIPVVSSTGGSGAGSLSEIIANAPVGTTITFDPSLDGEVIDMTGDRIYLSKALTIDASGLPGGLTISGADVWVAAGGDLTLSGLTMSTCSASASPSTALRNDLGGVLAVHRSTLTGCGIFSAGELVIIDSTVTGSERLLSAIRILQGGTATIRHSTISGNVTSTTLSGTAGGIWNWGTLNLENSIVAGNTSKGTNVCVDISQNSLGGELIGTMNVVGANLIGSNACVEAVFPEGPLVGTDANPLDPQLAPQDYYGGPTPTMLPYASSPAIDAAVFNGNSPSSDQRGVFRPQGPANDLGAVERQASDINPDDGVSGLVVLSDQTGDGKSELAVVRTDSGSIDAELRDGVTGALLRNISFFGAGFTPIAAAALADADGDGKPELAVVAIRDSDGRAVTEIHSLGGDSPVRTIWFSAGITPIGIKAIEGDADGNDVPELAVLATRDSDGRALVEVKNAYGPTNPHTVWAASGYTPLDLEVVPDSDGNGVPEVAVLSRRNSDGRIVVEVKNAAGATNPSAVWFMAGNTAIDLEVVADKDGNGIPEVAVLSKRNSDGRLVIEVKNARGPTNPSAVWFAAGHTGLALEALGDADGNAVPEIAVLSRRVSDNRILVEVKNAIGATNPRSLWFPAGYTALDLAILNDADGNGIQEAGVLMTRDSDGRILVESRNAAGAQAPKDYWFSP